jgi:predicted GNAT family acetyltransferase
VVGAGLYTAPEFGLTEIAGVAVLPNHQRRGIAGAITAALTTAALDRGIQPFLQFEHDEPARVYERVGYRQVGELADARRVRD